MRGTINNALYVNVGAAPEELIHPWMGVTIWGGYYEGVRKAGVQGGIPVYESFRKGRVINHNVTEGLPFTDSSVISLYSSHFIEHLNFTEGKNFLKEGYRVLKPGGIIRIVCPDLTIWLDKLTAKEVDRDFFNTYKQFVDIDYFENYLYSEVDNLKTKFQVFNSMILNWEHKWMWEYESFKLELENIGYKNIKKCSLYEGKMERLKEIESCLPENKIRARELESIYIEAER